MRRTHLFSFLLLCASLLPSADSLGVQLPTEPVTTAAVFGKSQEDWNLFLNNHINRSIPVIHCAPAGKFYVEAIFLIGKTGMIETVKPRTKIGYGMEEELMRVIRLSSYWKPATQNGRPCREYRCETFVFEVNLSPAFF